MTGPVADWTSGVPRLLLSWCDQCGNCWYLPRERCTACGSVEATAIPTDGDGLCVALTTVHVTVDGADPVRLSLVELDEGPVVMGRAEPGLQAGDRAQVGFRPAPDDDVLLPYFSRKD